MRKHRLLSIMLIIAVLLTSGVFSKNTNIFADEITDSDKNDSEIWNGEIAEAFETGQGTSSDPYIINTASELALFAKGVNDGLGYDKKCFKLGKDIYLNNSGKWKKWSTESEGLNNWSPIGTKNRPFKGEFDGDGKTIYGLYVYNESDYSGLFGMTSNAAITNVTISYAYVTGNKYVGGLCGYAYGTQVSDCVVYANISGTSNYVAGVVGYYHNGYIKVTISNCSFWGAVSGNGDTGGIIGDALSYSSKELTINNCDNNGTINGKNYGTGGIAGRITVDMGRITISNCSNKGEVFGENETAGILGTTSTDDGEHNGFDVHVIQCRNLGSITGNNSIGGVLGYTYPAWGTQVAIEQSMNSGTVKGNSDIGGVLGGGYAAVNAKVLINNCYNEGYIYGANNVGGIHGNFGVQGYYGTEPKTAKYCYNIGMVESTGNRGGIAGYSGESSFYTDCFYLDTSVIAPTNTNGIKYDMSQMKDKYNFTGFDFSNIWKIATVLNEGRPYLDIAMKDYDGVLKNEAGGYLNIGDKNCKEEFDIYVNGMPRLSDEDARMFLAFIYNDKDYKKIDLTSDKNYKILTGNLNDYEGNLSALKADMISLCVFSLAQIDRMSEESAESASGLNDQLVEYFQSELKGMDGLEASICNEYISTLKGYLTDGLKYFAANTIAEHSNLVITEEEFDKCKLAIDTYKDLGKCEGKLEKYLNRVLAVIHGAEFVIDNDKTGRYQYFMSYINNRRQFDSPNDEVFQTLMDSNFTIIKDNTYISSAIDMTTWLTGVDSWSNHRSTIDTWAEYLYTMQNYINTDVHDFQNIGVPSTCEQGGYTEFKCKYCGMDYISDYIKPIGHHFEYSAQGNVITAICVNDNTHIAKASLYARNSWFMGPIYYNGSEQKCAYLSYGTDWKKYGLPTDTPIIYSGDLVNCGKVTPKASIENATAECKYTIYPASIKYTYEMYDGIYDGNSHDAVKLNIENDSINVEYSVDDGQSWSSECPHIRDCGELNLIVRLTGDNYQESTFNAVAKVSHDLQHVEAKEATAQENGNVEYWYCSGCDKYFLDEDGKTETTKADVSISKLINLNVSASDLTGKPIVVDIDGSGEYKEGSKINLNAPDIEDYEFIGWFEDNSDGKYTDNNLLSDDKAFNLEIKDKDISCVAVYRDMHNTISTLGYSLSLKDNIGVNIYTKISNDILKDGDAKVEFIHSDGSMDEKNLSEFEDAVYQDTKVKKISYDVVPAEMSDYVEIKVVKDDGTESNTFSCSVASYARDLLSRSDTDDACAKAANLVKAMLNYGAFAQMYFDINTANMANDEIDNGNCIVPDFQNIADSIQNEEAISFSNEDLDYFGASLLCESETSLKLTFINKTGIGVEQLKEKYDIKLPENDMHQVDISAEGSFVWIKIKNIKPTELGKDYCISISDALIQTSPMVYMKKVFEAGEDEKLMDICRALYLYNCAALEYIDGEQ